METLRQRCGRLIGALEDLADQESACVRSNDFAAAIAVQRRAAPLVADLVEKGPAVADAALRQRLATVIALREQTTIEIQRRIEDTRNKLDALRLTRNRVSQVAPVYGSTRAPRSRLRAVG